MQGVWTQHTLGKTLQREHFALTWEVRQAEGESLMPSAKGAAGTKPPRAQKDAEYPVPLPRKVTNFWSLVALTTHSPKVTCTHWAENEKPEAVEFELDTPAQPGWRAERAYRTGNGCFISSTKKNAL